MALHGEPARPIATYSERFAHLRRDYRLYASQIVVTGTIGGDVFETTIPLRQLVPEFGVRWFRAARFYYGTGLFLVMLLFVGVVSAAPADSIVRSFQIGGSAIALWALSWSLLYFRKRPLYNFLNEGGAYVLDFIAEGPDGDPAREFAETVARTIRECKAHRD